MEKKDDLYRELVRFDALRWLHDDAVHCPTTGVVNVGDLLAGGVTADGPLAAACAMTALLALMIYAAPGAVVVVYSPARDAQVRFLRAPRANSGVKETRAIRPSATTRGGLGLGFAGASSGGGKPFACVAFSGKSKGDKTIAGSFVAAGERGHQPAAVVWNLAVAAQPLAEPRTSA